MSLCRIIPVLLLDRRRLVKTVQFRSAVYIGDPVNTLRLFNEKAADEIMLLDIGCARDGRPPDEELLCQMSSECFMPLCYGGGVKSLAVAKRLFGLGIEKVSINTALWGDCMRSIAETFGSQSVVYCLDVRRGHDGSLRAFGRSGTLDLGPALDCAVDAVSQGAGEIIVHMIDREGTYGGYDLDAVNEIASAVPVPVVACGGARTLDDLRLALKAGASAAAAGSLFCFIGRLRGVLISYPTELERAGLPS
jgi:cyclase